MQEVVTFAWLVTTLEVVALRKQYPMAPGDSFPSSINNSIRAHLNLAGQERLQRLRTCLSSRGPCINLFTRILALE